MLRSPPPKAVEAASSGRVVRLSARPERWLVLGEHGDYIVIPGLFCSCPGFTIGYVLSRRLRRPCYHVVAVELARRSGRFVDLSDRLGPAEVAEVVYEAVATGRSASVRRLLGDRV